MSSHLTPYLLARSSLTKIFVRVYLGQTDEIRQGTRSQMALITEGLEGEGGLQVQLDPGLK